MPINFIMRHDEMEIDEYNCVGTTGLAIWAVTLAGLLAGGALLVYNTSALVQ